MDKKEKPTDFKNIFRLYTFKDERMDCLHHGKDVMKARYGYKESDKDRISYTLIHKRDIEVRLQNRIKELEEKLKSNKKLVKIKETLEGNIFMIDKSIDITDFIEIRGEIKGLKKLLESLE